MNNDYSYWTKQDKPLFKDLEWNFPEQKTNTISVIGGNGQSFSNIIKNSEYLEKTYPIKTVKTYLPDSLRSKLPVFPNLDFLPSTDSGSFAKSPLLTQAIANSDLTLLAGDFSKNSETEVALAEATKTLVGKTFVVTRDAVDTLTQEMSNLIEQHNFVFLATTAQLQKIFRALYYPKMILLSMPILPMIETLHKFTLSYEKVTIVTFHQNQIIVANKGKVITTPIENTKYSPLTLWITNLAGDLAAYNLWNPGKPLEASSAALLK